MNARFRRLITAVLGDYQIYRVFASGPIAAVSAPLPATHRIAELGSADFTADCDPLMREQRWYSGDGSIAFGYLENERIVGVCFYWYGARYRERNFWPLADGEAKLVQIVTSPTMRGRGVARRLIESSQIAMRARGFDSLYARIWHSNSSSIAAFAAAGWSSIATVAQFNPLRLARPWRFTLGKTPRGRF